MSGPIRTRLQTVFQLDRLGNTLVIVPAGDAVSFGLSALHAEVTSVLEVLKRPDLQHVILDLSRSNYFGSLMIGYFLQFANAVRERGGRCAVCHVSPDMADVFRLMKLENLWEEFGTRQEAVRKLATISFTEHLWRLRKAGIVLLLAALFVGIYYIIPRPQYDRIYYEDLRKILAEAEDLKARRVSDTEWDVFHRKVNAKLPPMIQHLERYANADRTRAREVLYLARDYLPAMIVSQPNEQQQQFAYLGKAIIESIESQLSGGASTFSDFQAHAPAMEASRRASGPPVPAVTPRPTLTEPKPASAVETPHPEPVSPVPPASTPAEPAPTAPANAPASSESPANAEPAPPAPQSD